MFPIEAHSEKRIKITYTQVLPRRGDQVRYSYALQSEMLRQHPLRELSIDVKVASAMPLVEVTSPTHMTRNRHTKHSAQVEFSAEEYTPSRDFEVVIRLEPGSPPVTVLPHRRGDDGYFMALVSPSPGTAQPDRALVPDGDPLDLLVLADTSGSVDAASREARDRVHRLAAGGADASRPVQPGHLRRRMPLGVRQVASGRGQAPRPGPRVSDRAGSRWAGPISIARSRRSSSAAVRRRRWSTSATGSSPPATATPWRSSTGSSGSTVLGRAACHAVAPGSSFEPGVLRGIASLGGGSFRPISGQQGPQAVAVELLGEMTRPAIRDLAVRFEGLRVDCVYPGVLPNLAAGTQQVLLGRYLPDGQDRPGRLTVTGTQDGRPVQFTTPIVLKDAERGNSFIPRLWARGHPRRLVGRGHVAGDSRRGDRAVRRVPHHHALHLIVGVGRATPTASDSR